MFALWPRCANLAFAAFDDIFDAGEIERIRNLAEVSAKEIAGAGGKDEVKDIRSSRIAWLRTSDADHYWIFERLALLVHRANSEIFGLELTAVGDVQLTEYDEGYGGHYRTHTDMAYGDGVTSGRKLSLTVQLSDPSDYEGGDLVLYHADKNRPFVAPRMKGTVTLFRSHIIHEVTPVTRGRRYSLVAWVFGPALR